MTHMDIITLSATNDLTLEIACDRVADQASTSCAAIRSTTTAAAASVLVPAVQATTTQPALCVLITTAEADASSHDLLSSCDVLITTSRADPWSRLEADDDDDDDDSSSSGKTQDNVSSSRRCDSTGPERAAQQARPDPERITDHQRSDEYQSSPCTTTTALEYENKRRVAAVYLSRLSGYCSSTPIAKRTLPTQAERFVPALAEILEKGAADNILARRRVMPTSTYASVDCAEARGFNRLYLLNVGIWARCGAGSTQE